MSTSYRYLIQLEGPFGETEVEKVIQELNGLPTETEFKLYGYDTIFGIVNRNHEEEVVKIVTKTTPIQILSCPDDGKFENIWT